MSRRRIHPMTTAEELGSHLEGALKFILKHNAGKDPQVVRARAIGVLDLVKKHLDDLGVDPPLTQTIDDIRMAFVEAERGIVDPFFEPEPLSGRPPTELNRLFVMMKASLAIDLLMKAGETNELAAREVGKQLEKKNITVGGKNDVADWKTIRGWRRELAKAARGNTQHTDDWVFYGSFYLTKRANLIERVDKGEIDPLTEAKKQLDTL